MWDYPNPHTLSVTPRPDDIDGLNHTNNAVYVKWCEQVAWSHSEVLGLDLDDYRRLDRAMAIRRSEYDYLLATYLGDQLTLGTWLVSKEGNTGTERRFQIVRDIDGLTVLRARWDLVCIQLSNGRVRRMPAEFAEAYVPIPADCGN
jgi:acyl-CoA thioester hydrolase